MRYMILLLCVLLLGCSQTVPAPTPTSLPEPTTPLTTTATTRPSPTPVSFTATPSPLVPTATVPAATNTVVVIPSATAPAVVVRQVVPATATYRTKAPAGLYVALGQQIAISYRLGYAASIGIQKAGTGRRFILANIKVYNGTDYPVSVNPLYATLISTDELAVTLDAATFELPTPFAVMDLPGKTYAIGEVAFRVNQDFNPKELLWQDLAETIVIPITP